MIQNAICNVMTLMMVAVCCILLHHTRGTECNTHMSVKAGNACYLHHSL